MSRPPPLGGPRRRQDRSEMSKQEEKKLVKFLGYVAWVVLALAVLMWLL